ncbi:MAG: dihydrolipoyl dehydrogenase, partial [Bdellovibrionaceae bacterium]|nr:dihydrolipoyl dehydrogenase [Pseudobdellovibrionaceae bacterium]
MSSENFDVVVIGSGPGGYVAAIRAAQLGMKTACIEKYPTRGGTCLNVGCIPSKALLESSEHFSATQHSLSDHGVNVSGVSLDLDKMLKRKDTIVRQLTQGIDYLLKKNKITSITGMGKITNADGDLKTVEVTTAEGVQTIQTKKIIIATGSKPVELPFLPFDKETVVSSTGALQFPRVPQHLVVIGGGVIGLELGSVWHRLGAKVTIVEFSDHICGGMDQETSKELKKVLEKQGMNFLLSHECKGSQKSGDIHLVEVLNRETQETSQLECDFILVSTGRKPYTEGLGLDEVGIQKDNRGRVVINDHFETNIQGVYAIGDVVSGPMLAHKA